MSDGEERRVVRKKVDFLGSSLSFECDWDVGIGGSLWTSGLLMCSYMHERKSNLLPLFKGKRVVELGSGTGLVGMFSSFLAPSMVYLTDLHSHLDIMRKNLGINFPDGKAPNGCQLVVEELEWGSTNSSVDAPVDVILGTDVVYLRELYVPFIKALNVLCGPHTVVFLGFNRMDTAVDFFDMLVEEGYEYYKIPDSHVGAEFDKGDYALLKIMRCQEDADLLEVRS